MAAGRENGLDAALLDRLLLDEDRIGAIAAQVRDIAALTDPVGEVIDGKRLANGLDVKKVRVPLGVVAVVYEARPNVTSSRRAVPEDRQRDRPARILPAAAHSNAVLARIAADAAVGAGLPEGTIGLWPAAAVRGAGRSSRPRPASWISSSRGAARD